MKYKTILILLFVFPIITIGQDFKAMTYNIKYDNVNDTINNWIDRKAEMVQLIKKHSPSIIGMQEVLAHQLDYLNTSLTEYNYIGVGRDDGKHKGEFSPILYNTTKFKVLKSNTFWLSITPSKISIGWDASMERICTYGLFEDLKNHEKIWVFNTHFDHKGVKARKKSVKLILRKIKKLNKEKLPVIVLGDFNLLPELKPIKQMQRKMSDASLISNTSLIGPIGTFNGFDTKAKIDKRIDYIFTQGFTIESYHHIDERLKTGKHISDHLPVLASISKK